MGAVAQAAERASSLRLSSDEARARLLSAIASKLEGAAAQLVAASDRESALGAGRLSSELARTVGQLRMFARMAEEGSYVEPMIDVPLSGEDGANPDVRRMLVPLGPVAVFEAGNFPLAFGAAGGDVASALAVGCPVVLKIHPLHPETSSLTAELIWEALDETGLERGAYGVVEGESTEVGRSLVESDHIEAVAFTGSLVAGRALHEMAATRPRPIPFYGELGSTNPLIVTRSALARRGISIASGLAASVSNGSGQFCTRPSLVFVPGTSDYGQFRDALIVGMEDAQDSFMLGRRGVEDFQAGLGRIDRLPGVDVRRIPDRGPSGGYTAPRTVVEADGAAFLEHPSLKDELFGPAVVMIKYGSEAQLDAMLRSIGGALAGAVHAEPEDQVGELMRHLTAKCGRIVWNGYPTGVSVVPAMQHGGPFPSTTNSLFSSVGTTAARRFLRPVAYQNVPRGMLPNQLRDENPRRLWRLVNGRPNRSEVRVQT